MRLRRPVRFVGSLLVLAFIFYFTKAVYRTAVDSFFLDQLITPNSVNSHSYEQNVKMETENVGGKLKGVTAKVNGVDQTHAEKILKDLKMVKEGEKVDRNLNVFKPSTEWAVIPEGYAVPQGIHVRMNLQTGLKEGKLLDDSDRDGDLDNSPSVIKRVEKVVDVQANRKKLNEIKDRFETYKTDGGFMEDSKTIQSILFKLIEIRENHNNLEASESEEASKLMDSLEDLIHQTDNASDFTKMGGMELLVEFLKDKDVAISSQAALVMGSAVQR